MPKHGSTSSRKCRNVGEREFTNCLSIALAKALATPSEFYLCLLTPKTFLLILLGSNSLCFLF